MTRVRSHVATHWATGFPMKRSLDLWSLNAYGRSWFCKDICDILMAQSLTEIPRNRAQMGKALLEYSPLFRKTITECDDILAGLSDKPSWSIAKELQSGSDATNIHKAEYSQPLCTALQLGLVTLLDSWGLKPDVVIGHSSGEIAAAYAAGFMSMSDAITNAYYRGLVLSEGIVKLDDDRASGGSMCAIGLSQDKAIELLGELSNRIQLAAVNSPTSCTLSGDHDAIDEIIAICRTRGHFCRKLRVDVGKLVRL